MLVMTDTNILISAVLFPESKISFALKNIADNHELILCDYILKELETVLARKFKYQAMNTRNIIRVKYKLIPTEYDYETFDIPAIRDINNAPILGTAVKSGIDILITGDKDFLALKELLFKPQIMTIKEFTEV